jgi:hypothetical protein
MKTRAIVVLSAGSLFCLLMGAVLAGLIYVSTTHHMTSVSRAVEARFYGTSLVGVLTLFSCGVIILVNGVLMLKRGRPNNVLSLAMIAVFIAALYILWQAASILPAS